MQDCLRTLADLKSVHQDLVVDTEWLAGRLSGSSSAPPGEAAGLIKESDLLIALVHAKTPMKPQIKEYLLNKVDDLPGAISSSKGRRTKNQNFQAAVDASQIPLFRQMDHGAYEKLLVDWSKLSTLMALHGGSTVFGSWELWGCTFDLRHQQQNWEDATFKEMQRFAVSFGDESASQLRPTVATLEETIHLEDFRAYVLNGGDRRQQVVDAYLRRHELHGRKDGPWSTISVEYYNVPGYGRLLARGPGGQKLTREARAVAFKHLVEIDAGCCHPRLLRRLLQKLGMWKVDEFAMLNLFCEHYASWRKVLACYLDVDLDVAKTDLIRIFYGGKPSCDVPFLRKLGAEIQKAATQILQHEYSSKWLVMYCDRSNPDFSRLSAILSFEEAAMLDRVRGHPGVSMSVALFDGAYIQCQTLGDEALLREALKMVTQEYVPMSIKTNMRDSQWLGGTFLRCPETVLQRAPGMCVAYSNCLLNAIASLDASVDLSVISDQVQATQERGLCAKDFNEASTFGSQRTNPIKQLILCDLCDVLASRDSHMFLCHEAGEDGRGHWWGFVVEEPGVILHDSLVQFFHMAVPLDVFKKTCETASHVSFFKLQTVDPTTSAVPHGHKYLLCGTVCSGIAVTTPLEKCVRCSSPLHKGIPITATIYTLTGPVEVQHCPKRCTWLKCRIYYHYNYRWVGGKKVNTLSAEESAYIFVTSKTGFEKAFLKYHQALQFRGYLSNSCIARCQEDALWPANYTHARFDRDYGLAAFLLATLQEFGAMWSRLKAEHRMDKLRSLDIDAPMTPSLLKEYNAWWHKCEITKKERASIQEVVMDGHEKTATRCLNNPPSHHGRPRANGHEKLRFCGWFMVVDPATGLILAVQEMQKTEDNQIAQAALENVVPTLPHVNCVIYDRACKFLKCAASIPTLRKIRHWCVDKFHAKGHSSKCPCSPLVQKTLARRVKKVNTSVCEQTFAWFRGYARTFNTMQNNKQRFLVLSFARKHNALMREGDSRHLNAFSAKKQQAQKAGVLKRPKAKQYSCRK